MSNDDVCLDRIFTEQYGSKPFECPECGKFTKFHKVSGRKCYACQFCGHQIHPLADTIFCKFSTPLTMWFYAICLFIQSKNGVAAKELERELGVTYKTAWRMGKQIRLFLKQEEASLPEQQKLMKPTLLMPPPSGRHNPLRLFYKQSLSG